MYDPREYWLREGRKTLPPRDDAKTEAQLALLRPWVKGRHVHEIGCGWGRITTALLGDTETYSAMDISPGRVKLTEQAVELLPARSRARLVSLHAADIRTVQPKRQLDVVFGVEVFMHIPPTQIVALVEQLSMFLPRYIINLDWHEAYEHEADEHNFQHLYTEIYRGLPPLKELRVFPLHAFKQSLFVAELAW